MVDERIDSFDAFGPWATDAGTNFEYDATGRLRAAKSRTMLSTTTSPTAAAAAPRPTAGRNGNRTSVIDNAGTPTTYCYDHADRLVSTSDPAVGTLAYDSHGNTTTLGTQTLIYDGADRHLETKLNGTTAVRYQRDATGRIIKRTEGTAVTRYGSGGPGDSPSFVMDAGNTVLERTIGLVGGVMVTKRGGLLGVGDVWSYPNIHGDVMAVANHLGVKQGATMTYDPFGNGADSRQLGRQLRLWLAGPAPAASGARRHHRHHRDGRSTVPAVDGTVPRGGPRGGRVGERLRLLLGRPDQLLRPLGTEKEAKAASRRLG